MFERIIGSENPGTWSALDQPLSRSLVAETPDGNAVGFVEAQRAGDDVEIIMIATGLQHRRCGIADVLLRSLIANASQENAARVILEVAEDNTAARALYLKHGFVEIARRPGYYHRNRDGLLCDALLLAYRFDSAAD